ncbi:DUF2256 domain-containing protein [Iodobacter arcticus]|uniref:DUF2256 domain-containing protein n=1 Tax=Iodobacter arcticus TaxID=590593 RepID=A0ABW2QUQ6_9NEIS
MNVFSLTKPFAYTKKTLRQRLTLSEVFDLMAHHKLNLPQKTCPICQRPFVWRKKWEKNWESVKYCSVRCAQRKSKA